MKGQLSQCFNAAVEEGVFDERIGLMMCMNEMKPIKVKKMMQVDDFKQRIKILQLIQEKDKEYHIFNVILIF